jgi:hypothetical protein
MKQITFISIITLSLSIFAGCVQKTPNVAFNAAAHNDIKKIDIIAPKKVEDLTIFYFNHPGMNFGLLGALAASAEFETKETSYNSLLENEKFDADNYFLNKLESELKNNGYQVNIIKLKEERDGELLKKYPISSCDAYLDTVLGTVGYTAGSPSSDYKATVRIASRLVKAKDKSIIYDKHIAVGENFALSEEVDYLGAEDEYFYTSFDTLKENAIKSIEGIKKGLDKVAIHIAQSLKQ